MGRRLPAPLALALVLAAACAEPQRVPGPEPDFSAAALPGNWTVAGAVAAEGRLSVVEKDGVPALKVVNGEGAFAVARRTRAMVLVTPYLSWAWNMDPQGRDAHPVGLLVGFAGGTPGRPDPAGAALPPHDRALAIVWGDSALKRGSFEDRARGGAVPRYTQRGGRENAGSWWLETVDLANLYARAWPGDDVGRAQVVFIAIRASGGGRPVAAHISGILISR